MDSLVYLFQITAKLLQKYSEKWNLKRKIKINEMKKVEKM